MKVIFVNHIEDKNLKEHLREYLKEKRIEYFKEKYKNEIEFINILIQNEHITPEFKEISIDELKNINDINVYDVIIVMPADTAHIAAKLKEKSSDSIIYYKNADSYPEIEGCLEWKQKLQLLEFEQENLKKIITSKTYSKAELFEQVMQELNIKYTDSNEDKKRKSNYIDKITLKLKNFLMEAFSIDLDIFVIPNRKIKNYSFDSITANILMEITYQLLTNKSSKKDAFINKLEKHSYDKITSDEIKDFIKKISERLEKEFEIYIINEADCSQKHNICNNSCPDFYICNNKMTLKSFIKDFEEKNYKTLEKMIRINENKKKTLDAVRKMIDKITYYPVSPFIEPYFSYYEMKIADNIALTPDERIFFSENFNEEICNVIDEYENKIGCYNEFKEKEKVYAIEELASFFDEEKYKDDDYELLLIQQTFENIMNS